MVGNVMVMKMVVSMLVVFLMISLYSSLDRGILKGISRFSFSMMKKVESLSVVNCI